MHMADSLLSPAVGALMWGASAGLIAYSSKKVQREMDDSKASLMGVLGAFVFAAQMINFSIPGTGSSGHLGGALLLSILMGKHAAFLTISSVLAIQALLFADGGLLALGANIFNLGFFPCFLAYPLVYKPVTAGNSTKYKLITGICLAAVAGLQMGAFGVVFETQLSGITEIPFLPFLLLMQPIHLAIGLVEGLVTAMAVLFILKARPELQPDAADASLRTAKASGLLIGFLLAALVTGGVISWFASSDPDGLEWSIMKVLGQGELPERDGLHALLADWQRKIAVFPDYSFPVSRLLFAIDPTRDQSAGRTAVDGSQSAAAVIGVLITLLAAGAVGTLLRRIARRIRNC